MLSGTMLTGKQLGELNSATDLVKSLKRAMQGIYHEGDSRTIDEDLDGLLELVGVVFQKLDFVACDDDLNDALLRMPNMSQPEKLSELIVQLFRLYKDNGDMRVFMGDMKPLGTVEVEASPEDPEENGEKYLHIGPY